MAANRHFLALIALVLAAVGLVGFVDWRESHRPHNVIIFVADGLRSGIVTDETAPTMAEIRREGVDFHNSHSLFPTVTTANASAIATGHRLGDTGDWANTIFPLEPAMPAWAPSHMAGLENDGVLGDMNARFGGNYLNETTLLAAARAAGYQTAAIGKVGPTAIQDVTSRDGHGTVVIDDATGQKEEALPLAPEIAAAIRKAGLEPATPERIQNAFQGDYKTPGTRVANVEQQNWLVQVATKVLLPRFARAHKPFVMVYWSRDPDGSQHNTGDSLNKLVPGINGPTVMAAIRNADNNLAALRQALRRLGLERTTDIVVTADHGFSVLSRQSATSYAATRSYLDVQPHFVPPGFLSIDLSHALGLPLYDPMGLDIDLGAGRHPKGGSALIGKDFAHPDIMIGGNGGANLIWLRSQDRALASRIVEHLTRQDYVAGIFVNDDLGPIPGTLPMSAVGLKGAARTPAPSIIVSSRSYSTGCRNAELCAAEVDEAELQQGQGNHGSFSRANTHNFMAAIGPDFRRRYFDPAPVSNADLTITLAHILKLPLQPKGPLGGRYLAEARRGAGVASAPAAKVLRSQKAANGFYTELHYQDMGGQHYFDWAGMPGRVVTGPNG